MKLNISFSKVYSVATFTLNFTSSLEGRTSSRCVQELLVM